MSVEGGVPTNDHCDSLEGTGMHELISINPTETDTPNKVCGDVSQQDSKLCPR
jgi:hypothetical protein